jgi:uncharacterized SAM-binding protein YcdF (DUF218 family)
MTGRFFPLAKLSWAILAPSHLLLWLTLATGLALIAGRQRLGKGLAIVTALLFVVFGLLPTGYWLAERLEDQYPRPAALPARVDGILDLGGGLGADILAVRHAPAEAPSEARLVSTYELARRYPNARVVFSGGWGRYPDAAGAAYAFAQMGLDPKRLTLESQSHDTFENLVFSRRLVRPKPGEVWVLTTSAFHLPRAMAVARRLGWNLIPWPTDYLTRPGARPLADYLHVFRNVALSDAALHEDIGLIAYRMRDLGGAAQLPPPSNAASSRALSNAAIGSAAP